MSDLKQDLAITKIVSLMNSYSFDTNQLNAKELVQKWLQNYDVNWIYLATIEALYLGRYKAISIEHLMSSWARRGQPTTHFGGDFERVICRKLPRHLSALNSFEREEIENIEQPQEENSNNSDRNLKFQQSNSDLLDRVSAPNPVISTQVTPFPSSKPEEAMEIPPAFSEISPQNSEIFAKNNTQAIETFQPLPDASSFFQKLKALADNQRENGNQS